jgi:LacI family transcriptional regulator
VAVCIDTRDGAGRKRLHGVAQYARGHGWRMMLVRRGGREAAQEVLRLRPHGIVAYVADRWLVETACRLKVPLADTAHGEVEVPLLTTLDNDAAGRLAAEHLASLGLTHFGYCGVRGRTPSEDRRARLAEHLGRGRTLHAFAQRIAEGELRLDPLVRWLRNLPKPVGLLAFDDKLGERVLTACRWAGLPVPERVAVLGIGDDELMCEVSWPSLSSISFPTSRLGYEAAEMLDRAMAGGRVVQRIRKIEPTGVTVRTSTDMLAVEDPLIRSAVRFLREHAREPIGVKHVAIALDVSRRTLDRRFVDLLGRTVHDELAAVRMKIARGLLAEGRQPLGEIAEGCGYATAASFSRAFRHYVGCWPSDYRDKLRVV